VRESFPADLRSFGSLLLARKWIIIAVTVAVLGTAVLLSLLQAPVYKSTASVLVEVPSGQTPSVGPNMATEKRVATSSAVAKIVLARLHLSDPPDKLLRGLSVEVPVDTEILNVGYAARDPDVAQQRAETFAQAYLIYREQKLGDDVLATQKSLQEQITTLNRRLDTLQNRAGAATDERQRAVLTAQASLLSTQINNLYLQQADLTRTRESPPGRILADAEVPDRPSSPNYLVNGSLGLALGLLLGIGAAILREATDDRIRGSEELESEVGAAVLGTVPTVPALRGAGSDELVTIHQPESHAAEAFWQLRANFVVAAQSRGAKSVLVTSPGAGQGKTFTTANLGIVLAKSGSNVILLSGDVRQPRLEQLFGLSDGVGLARILEDRAAGRFALKDTGSGIWSVTKNLMVIPVGPSDGIDSTEMLGSSTMAELIQDLRDLADFVLIDAAPLLPVADAAALLPACDAVLLVADARSATRADMLETRHHLDRIQANTLGAVLVNARSNGTRFYPHRG
jgi:capsular exopolysaccharide synthesis family protein